MTAHTAAGGRAASVADAVAYVDVARRTPDAARGLAAMLDEQSPLFSGLGTNEAERLRGYILASFETTGLPQEAVPFVLEELETGYSPYTVAAAARALRGAAVVPEEAPQLLVGAIARLRGADDVVSFERFAPTATSGSAVTALVELARTLVVLGPRANRALPELRTLVAEGESFSPAVRAELARAAEALGRPEVSTPACCCAEEEAETEVRQVRTPIPLAARAELEGLSLEDQDGRQLTFSEAFLGRPTALSFFYTRCMNPDKCSLTVTKLARLAHHVAAEALDANVVGISYDPGFDRPARLQTYGRDRGMPFSPRSSLLRTVGPFDQLRDAFELGVGFGPVTVNRHRIDLVVLDASLNVAARFERRLWQEDDVLEVLRAHLPPVAVARDRSAS